jgi:hypothetical protein
MGVVMEVVAVGARVTAAPESLLPILSRSPQSPEF